MAEFEYQVVQTPRGVLTFRVNTPRNAAGNVYTTWPSDGRLDGRPIGNDEIEAILKGR